MITTMLLFLQQLDQKVFLWLQGLIYGHHWLIVICVILASPGLFIALLIFVLLWFFGKSHDEKKQNRIALSSALLAALIARFILKEIITAFWSRPRPFETLTNVNQLLFRDGGGSFPSGHAVFSFAIAAVVGRYYPKTGIAFYAAAIFISISRVVAGVHWPSDILGGAVIGVGTGFLVYVVAKRFLR